MAATLGQHDLSILVVAVRRDSARVALEYLQGQGFNVVFARFDDLALALDHSTRFSRMAVVLAPEDDDRHGRAFRQLALSMPCVLVTSRPPIGPHDYVQVLQRDASAKQLYAAVSAALADEPDTSARRHQPLIGDSPAMQHVRELIERVAPSPSSVLILGESGTGKELVAREIHRLSRRSGAFVALNCGAVPRDLLESELFGHEKGAFTGAVEARSGRFERAAGGTLFLDEIGDMTPDLQVKILRVLQEQCYERVGGSRTRTADVRVLAATHRDLTQAMRDGGFRQDLYYRLAVFPVELPPLRARSPDIPALVAGLGKRDEATRMTARATHQLLAYDWPGNVRELANLLERLAILYPDGLIDVDQLPAHTGLAAAATRTVHEPERSPGDHINAMQLSSSGVDLRALVARMERRLITQALLLNDGVVAHAARSLGLRRTTLIEKLRKYDIGNG